MNTDDTKYLCAKCEQELSSSDEVCSRCGCTKRKISKDFTETVLLHPSMKARQKRVGFKKFAKEILQGWFTSKDKMKFPKGIYKTRVADKINDSYSEKVINAQTGKVERNITEKLSKHHNKKI